MSGRLAKIQDWNALARDANYDTTRLSELCRVSPRTIERFFRAIRRPTPQRWLNELRLQAAFALTSDGLKSVKEVAQEFGYKQRAHFSRVFKARYGVGPSQILMDGSGKDTCQVISRKPGSGS